MVQDLWQVPRSLRCGSAARNQMCFKCFVFPVKISYFLLKFLFTSFTPTLVQEFDYYISFCYCFVKLDERRRTKLNTLITFPEKGLDMSQHVSKRNNMTSLTNWSPWRRHKSLEPSADDFIYDLYAVCNHYGNMQGGHYTGNVYCTFISSNHLQKIFYSFCN